MDLWGMIRCATGTVGTEVLGGLAGASLGIVTLPIIGTVSGAAVGFWGGALVDAATSCYYSQVINNEIDENYTGPVAGVPYPL